MTVSDSDISNVLAAYLERHPAEAAQLAEPVRLLSLGTGNDVPSRPSGSLIRSVIASPTFWPVAFSMSMPSTW